MTRSTEHEDVRLGRFFVASLAMIAGLGALVAGVFIAITTQPAPLPTWQPVLMLAGFAAFGIGLFVAGAMCGDVFAKDARKIWKPRKP